MCVGQMWNGDPSVHRSTRGAVVVVIPVETLSPRSWNAAYAFQACFGTCALMASASRPPIQPVLKHGLRNLTCVRVNGLVNP